MSDEPLYCQTCGAEDFECDHDPETEGPYCEVCGVIPEPCGECRFYKSDGNDTGCVSAR